MEAEADVIPDAAEPHGANGTLRHFQGARIGRAVVAAQQKQQPVRCGKLGGRLEAAMPAVEMQSDVVVGPIQQPHARHLGRGEFKGLAERAGDLGRRGGDLVRFEGPERFHPFAQLDQTGASQAGAFGDVSCGEKRLSVRRHEQGERPAAAAVHHVAGRHVDGVDVGALLAVDLDAYKGVVQMARRLFVLEGLLFHHMAPVAGGIADGEEDGFVLGQGLGEGLLVPGVPIHGIVGVLQEIGAFFVYESIGCHGGPWVVIRVPGSRFTVQRLLGDRKIQHSNDSPETTIATASRFERPLRICFFISEP